MPRIVSVGTSVPEYVITQEEARAFAKELYGSTLTNMEVFLKIFDNPSIKNRYISKPKNWFLQDHSFRERNDAFIEVASKLGGEAIRACLQKAGVTIDEIDAFLFVSTTGLSTPSIDARLMNQLGMHKHVFRTPIWGLGCAGGVAGLSRAVETAIAFPDRYVLLLTVECCSLTFRKNDFSKSNVVATSLFSDGAAAVLVAGDNLNVKGAFPKVISSKSTLWPDSLDVMGWEIVDDGLKVVFSKEIPGIVSAELREQLLPFLEENQMGLEDISHYILHPGGMKVVKAYLQALGLREERLRHTTSVLRSHGNMSSSTVLFVLERELDSFHEEGSVGLMMALGPGFSMESLLLRWEKR